MNTKQRLQFLATYLESTRRVGHTTAMIDGAKSSDCIVLARNQTGADFLRALLPDGQIATLSAVEKNLAGQRKPLLLDNAALHSVLHDALGEITRLERKIDDMKRAARAIAEMG